jgi:hypothetical protein
MNASLAHDVDFADLRRRLLGPAPAPRMWSVRSGGPGVRVFLSAARAAEFIADETRRQVKAGAAVRIAVSGLEPDMSPADDASARVLDVLGDSGWTRQAANPSYAVAYRLRDRVADRVTSILEGL